MTDVFWSQEQQRHADNLRDLRDEQRQQRSTFTVTTHEAAKDVAPIDWLAEYERKADARQAAWEASPFAGGFALLTTRIGATP